MNCARCNSPNEAGRKFCRECGARLGVACPQCGTIDPAPGRFCGECGHPLADGAYPGAGEGVRPESAERRLVSVLFADLVGFTQLAEARDPEAVREILSEYYEIARELVLRYGGALEKFIGDAVMGLWGAPSAHEDDAERAVRCALEMVGAVRQLGDRRNLPRLELRAAVHTGEAAVNLAADGQGLVAGDVVNTASRLQTAAQPGTVVVGESTQRAAPSIAFRALGEQELRGKTAGVPVWQATHVVGAVGDGRRADASEPPFVGRAEELRLLKDTYHATERESRARLVSVMGIGGIGKSRLAWELEKYVTGLAEPGRWLQGRAPAYGEGIAYWSLAEMVRRAAGIGEREEDAPSREKLDRLLVAEVPLEEERRRISPWLRALLGLGETPTGGQAELFDAWRTFFERLAARSPLVMVFEDLHWADSGQIDFIENILEWSRNQPIIVVTLARRELLDRRPTWGAGQRRFISIELEPLSNDEMRELLAGVIPDLPREIVNEVLARAEGVPLYAVETIRMLLDRGYLEQSPTGRRLARPLAELGLPETLQALIAARLDGLPIAERQLLGQASVLGQTFTPQALGAVSGLANDELAPLLASLTRKELLRRETDPASPERGQYGFVQSAIREVAYRGLARAARRAQHLAAAEYLAALGNEEIVGAVAAHYVAAYEADPDRADAEQLRERARSTLLAAAERGQGLHSYQQTRTYLEQALTITASADERAQLMERAGDVARAAGDSETAQRYLGQAIEHYRSVGDRAAQARATSMLGRVLVEELYLDRAAELIERTLEEVGLEREDESVVALMSTLSRVYFNWDKRDKALAWGERAIALGERLEAVPHVIEALVTRGALASLAGRRLEAQAILRGAQELAERHSLWLSALRAAHNLIAVELEDTARSVLPRVESAIELARRAGEAGWVSGELHMLIQVLIDLGEWDEALRRIEEDGDLLVAHDWQHLNDSLAMIAAFRGQTERAAELLGKWVTDPERVKSDHEAAHRIALALVALAEGRFEEAYLRALESVTARDEAARGFSVAAHAALWLRNEERLGSAHESFAALSGTGRVNAARRATVAAQLALLGSEPGAVAAVDDALTRLEQVELALERALLLIELATFGPAERTDAALGEAKQILGPLGAEGAIERLRTAAAPVALEKVS